MDFKKKTQRESRTPGARRVWKDRQEKSHKLIEAILRMWNFIIGAKIST